MKIAIAAPSGTATASINGKTLHSLLRLPMKPKESKKLDDLSARNFQWEFQNLKFLIIDEMVGACLLHKIEKTLPWIGTVVSQRVIQNKIKLDIHILVYEY